MVATITNKARRHQQRLGLLGALVMEGGAALFNLAAQTSAL